MTGDAVHRGGAGVHLRGHPQAGRQLRQAHPPPPDLVPGRQGRHVRGQGEDTAHIQFNHIHLVYTADLPFYLIYFKWFHPSI